LNLVNASHSDAEHYKQHSADDAAISLTTNFIESEGFLPRFTFLLGDVPVHPGAFSSGILHTMESDKL
jgi:hypothetical protein